MLELYTEKLKPLSQTRGELFISRITSNSLLPEAARSRNILLVTQPLQKVPHGFDAVIVLQKNEDFLPEGSEFPDNLLVVSDDQSFLGDGDVVRLNPDSLTLHTMYRKNSSHNSLLVTERCNHYCLMCSQPPREIDDGYIVDDLFKAIPLMSRETREIGITGGEPTLLGARFVQLLSMLKNYLPSTGIHVLTNGRTFSSRRFVEKVAALDCKDLMFGIPIYSDVSHLHNYVVQAENAFDQTIKGILNLKTYRQKVEIRVVIHKQTYERLPQLAEFIVRNLLFVDHVALMGLEMMGFTKTNIDELWIDPTEYQDQLRKAVRTLSSAKIRVSVYNHQLCLLDRELWPFSVKSISDWKNEYMKECAPCSEKQRCGGFFSSAKFRYSDNIQPIR